MNRCVSLAWYFERIHRIIIGIVMNLTVNFYDESSKSTK